MPMIAANTSRTRYARLRISAPGSAGSGSASDTGPGSDVGPRLDAPARDRLGQRSVVALVLVGVGLREVGQRPVQPRALAEVGRDRDRVPGAGVRLGQGPPAQAGVDLHDVRLHQLHERGTLRVPELADVEVARDALEVRGADPAEQDVARRLGQPLALDDAAAVVPEFAAAEEG